jgi:aryl-alcohol dehydrogenase-like predicted oxidoreductase
MQFVRLGESGLIISRLGFGAMTFTAGDATLASIYKVDEALADRMVSRTLEAGVNFFDTADAYANGQSEELLGRLLKGRREAVVIATKVGFRTGPALGQAGLSRRHILWSAEQSLRRLGTDRIDLYLCHKEDPFTPLEETLAALDELVRAGKVRYVGFSNWSAWKAAAALEIQKARGYAPFVTGQMHYSLVGRDVERDVLPMMRRYGLGLTVWSPLASGFLSGKYRPENLGDPANRLAGFDILPFDKAWGFQAVDRLREIAGARGCSPAQAAVAWLLARAGVACVLVGASKLPQLEDNLGAADIVLGAAEIARLDEVTEPAAVYPNWFIQRLIDEPQRVALSGQVS